MGKKSRGPHIRFCITISTSSGAQELTVVGGTPAEHPFSTEEADLKHSVEKFTNIAHGLVDSLMKNTNAAPTTVLSIKPTDPSWPTPFKLILHAHEAFEENGSFVVTTPQASRPSDEEHKSFRQACMQFWTMMTAMVVSVTRCNTYHLSMDPGPPIENVIYLDSPMGLRLASLTVQM